jgi:hypothetical protein
LVRIRELHDTFYDTDNAGGDWVSIGLVINLTVSLSVRMNGAWRKREHVAAWRNTQHRGR